MTSHLDDEKFMRRALQLAARGSQDASPNPMVGAVIVCDGKIIGEGYHRRCGEAHAEVNAVASVADPSLLSRSTIYVTLEPCAHYGKTPPCAKLLIDKKIPRVVVGTVDHFSKVDSKGIRMLREAGAEVRVGVLQDECREINRKFFVAHTLHRPFVTLKWACSADGFMGAARQPGEPPFRFSTPLTSVLVHQLRSRHDAILTSAVTAMADGARLTTRLYAGRSPRPVVVDRRGILEPSAPILQVAPDGARPIVYTGRQRPDLEPLADVVILPKTAPTLTVILSDLYARHGVTSLLVEAGPTLLQAFIASGLWDDIREERTPIALSTLGRFPIPHPSSPSH